MDVPPSLKSLAPYIRLSKQFEAIDPVVSYYCQLYFVQNGIKLAGKDDQSKTYLFGVMDRLEQVKRALTEQGNEAVSNDIVASSHIESRALQLFTLADREDRASNFDLKVIKGFYTSSRLFDLLAMFGELSEEVAHQQKYAKWKATYLDRCRKTGEVPVPGPQLHDEEQERGDQPGPSGELYTTPTTGSQHNPYPSTSQPSTQPQPAYNPPPQPVYNPPQQPAYTQPPTFDPPPASFASQPAHNPPPSTAATAGPTAVRSPGTGELLQLDLNQHVELSYEQIEKVQKLCRFASSALNYSDFSSCLDNLQKAMNLIRIGREQ